MSYLYREERFAMVDMLTAVGGLQKVASKLEVVEQVCRALNLALAAMTEVARRIDRASEQAVSDHPGVVEMTQAAVQKELVVLNRIYEELKFLQTQLFVPKPLALNAAPADRRPFVSIKHEKPLGVIVNLGQFRKALH